MHFPSPHNVNTNLQLASSAKPLAITFPACLPRRRRRKSCNAVLGLSIFLTPTLSFQASTHSNPSISALHAQLRSELSDIAQVPVGGTSPQPLTDLNESSGIAMPRAEFLNDLYELGPGDGLTLTFLDPSAESIGGPFTILLDGTANLPLLGSVELTGLTITQANSWLTSLYARMINRPDLYLSLVDPRPKRVTILGEVERPGLYPLPTLATSFDAITQAGGITLNADIRNVLLRRRTGGQGQQKQSVLNLAQLMQFGNQLQDPMLLDGDTIVVGRTDEPNPEEVMQLSASNITPATVTINVLGAVNRPGSVSVPANTPLDDVILRAGGVRDLTANQRNVELVRLNRNGTRSLDVFTLNKQAGVSNTENPPLRNGDTIVVRNNFFGKTLTVLNQFVFPIINTGTTLLNTYNIWDDYRFRFENRRN